MWRTSCSDAERPARRRSRFAWRSAPREPQLVRQLLTESLLLAAVGGLAGIGVGYLGVTFLRAIPIPSDFPVSLGTEMDMRLLAFSLVVSLATGVAFGLVPALRATRGDLASSIKAGDSGPARISILRGLVTGRNVLVTAQLALSVVLLVISADCIRGFQAAWRIDPGFRVDHTLFFSLDPNIQRYDEARTRDFYKKLTDRLRESGGVNAVSMSSSIPFSTGQTRRKYLAEGAQPRTSGDAPIAFSYKVDDHFFPLMETKILRGRGFDSRDTAKSPRVAVINELLANKLFGKNDPIGRRFRLDSADGPELASRRRGETGNLYLLGRTRAGSGMDSVFPGLQLPDVRRDAHGGRSCVLRGSRARTGTRARSRHADLPDQHHGGILPRSRDVGTEADRADRDRHRSHGTCSWR